MAERPLVSFWEGSLGWIERLSLRSMLAAGHTVKVFSYGGLEPEPGVEFADAADIMPRQSLDEMLVAAPPGSRERRRAQVVFSDVFRLELLWQGAGTWVDLDLLFVRPLRLAGPHVFGVEHGSSINNAVLFMARDSPMLRDLHGFVRQRPVLAPWWRGKLYWQQRLRIAIGRPLGPERLQWGVYGPRALTHFAAAHGVSASAQPEPVFYPVRHAEAPRLFDPTADIERCLRPETIAVHLWNGRIRELRKMPLAPGSFLDRWARKLDVAVERRPT